MIITEFPNSSASGISFSEFLSKLGKENILVSATHDQLFTKFSNSPLSLKTSFKGQEIYQFDGVENPVDADTFMMINQGRDYESIIESDYPVESFSVFFKMGMAEKILKSMHESHEKNLDDPFTDYEKPLFFEHIIDKKGPVGNIVNKLKYAVEEGESDRLLWDEMYYELMEALLRQNDVLNNEVNEIPSIKKSTRVELFKRLSKSRKYIHANIDTPLNLQILSEISFLSEYHFLRMFKAFYKTTPYQYITQRRLFKAEEYLVETDYPIKFICNRVGYQDESSFCRLFKKHTGLSPTEFRSDK